MTTSVPQIEIVSFPVEGMTCASCVNRITRFLRKVDGVEEANVNLASESATVRYDADRIGVADLVAAVDAAGYVARVEQAASADHEADVAEAAEARTERDEAAAGHVADLRRRLGISAILTFPLILGLARMTLGRPAVLHRRDQGPAPQGSRHEHASSPAPARSAWRRRPRSMSAPARAPRTASCSAMPRRSSGSARCGRSSSTRRAP